LSNGIKFLSIIFLSQKQLVIEQNKKNIIYISADGMLEPLGYSQVLKYLLEISSEFEITLISLEKKVDLSKSDFKQSIEDLCKIHNIKWVWLKYDNWPKLSSHLVNILKLFFVVFFLLYKKQISLIHIRSYFPGIIMPILQTVFDFKLIFDMRGLWADEKHDRLGWPKKSYKYQFFKRLESFLLAKSVIIIALTNGLKKMLIESRKISENKIEVIRTCTDSKEFFPIKENKKDSLTIGYLGSADTAYNFEEVVKFFYNFLRFHENSILKILSNLDSEELSILLKKHNIPRSKVELNYALRKELNREINSFDLVVFYLKENYSVIASMPTKIGEALSCGKPVVCNAFNRDISELIQNNHIGYLYNFKDEYRESTHKKIISLVNSETVESNCIKLAKREFDLISAAQNYLDIYKQVMEP